MIPLRSVAIPFFVLLALAGCKIEITSGEYGPVSVGQTKLEARAALKSQGLWRVHPVVYPKRYINNPTRADLAAQLSEDAGVMVWIGHHPWPLRIEFDGEFVTRTWPDDSISPSAPEHMKVKAREVARLQQRIKPGAHRGQIFDTIAAFETPFDVSVGNFVVGYQRFYVMDRKEIRANDAQYEELILANDGWRFNGLKDEIWYAPIIEPWTSIVTIYFREDRIERIEHEHFPIELP